MLQYHERKFHVIQYPVCCCDEDIIIIMIYALLLGCALEVTTCSTLLNEEHGIKMRAMCIEWHERIVLYLWVCWYESNMLLPLCVHWTHILWESVSIMKLMCIFNDCFKARNVALISCYCCSIDSFIWNSSLVLRSPSWQERWAFQCDQWQNIDSHHVLFLQEYNRCQAKVDKYTERERTGPNIVKLETVCYSIYIKDFLTLVPFFCSSTCPYLPFCGFLPSPLKHATEALVHTKIAAKQTFVMSCTCSLMSYSGHWYWFVILCLIVGVFASMCTPL